MELHVAAASLGTSDATPGMDSPQNAGECNIETNSWEMQPSRRPDGIDAVLSPGAIFLSCCTTKTHRQAQQAHPSRSSPRLILIGSEKSPPYSSLSSCIRAFLAMTSNACSTFTLSFALVSKYGICPLCWQYACALFCVIIRLSSPMSTLFPSTTKGNESGSRGDAWIKNSSRQESRVSNDFGELTS